MSVHIFPPGARLAAGPLVSAATIHPAVAAPAGCASDAASMHSSSSEIARYLREQDPRLGGLIATLHRESMWSAFLPGSAFRLTERSQHSDHALQEQGRSLQEELKPHVSRERRPVRYAVYPASGYDAVTATSAFPDAAAHILISGNAAAVDVEMPTVELDEKVFTSTDLPFFAQYGAVSSFARVTDLSEANGGMISPLLANLQVRYPSIDLQGIMVFCQAPDALRFPYDQRNIGAHTAIFYRPTPTSSISVLIYIQASLSPVHADVSVPALEATPARLRAALDLSFVDGLLVKGSQGSLCSLLHMNVRHVGQMPVAKRVGAHLSREQLLNRIAHNRGMVIEGMHSHPYYAEPGMKPVPSWEIFPDELFELRGEELSTRWECLLTSRTQLSYLAGMRVWGGRETETATVSGAGNQEMPSPQAFDLLDELLSRPAVIAPSEKPVTMTMNPFVPDHLTTNEGMNARAALFR
jgi:hypothetical protein